MGQAVQARIEVDDKDKRDSGEQYCFDVLTSSGKVMGRSGTH